MSKRRKHFIFQDMQYLVGENGEQRWDTSIGCFTFPIYGVPVQVSGRGLVAIRRFIKFQNRATRHAEKLAKALNGAAEAAKEASRFFYLDETPRSFGKEKEPPEQAAPISSDG